MNTTSTNGNSANRTPIQSFEGWKKAFESDPIGRKKSGVLRYRILRPADNLNYVIVDLVFGNHDQADATLTNLKKLWGQVEGKIMSNAQSRILNLVEETEL